MKLVLFAFFVLISSTLFAFIHHQQFSYCSDGQVTQLEKKIKLAGYYVHTTARGGLMPHFFYNDGAYAGCIAFADKLDIENIFSTKPKDRRSIYGQDWVRWGRYILEGDTIKTQSFYCWEMASSRVEEVWFLIINDSTLETIKDITFGKNDKITEHIPLDKDKYSYFVPHINKPDSVSWLNKKRWYYCR